MRAAYGIGLTRDDFALRTDDGMLGWHLLLAGAGIGVGQLLLARRHKDLEQVGSIKLSALPVWGW